MRLITPYLSKGAVRGRSPSKTSFPPSPEEKGAQGDEGKCVTPTLLGLTQLSLITPYLSKGTV